MEDYRPGPGWGKYYPTVEEVNKWVRVINREVFGGKLPKFSKVEVRRRRGIWADCTGEEDDRGKKSVTLSINNKVRCKQHLIEVIAHELVHHWEYTKYGTMAHTEKFKSWAPRLKEFKIPLNNYTEVGN